MTNKKFIKSQIGCLEEQIKIEKEIMSGNEIFCEEEIKKYNQVLKDLEELEELKKIMGTPIQDIMKRLKVLDIIQNYAIKYDNCVCIDAIFYDEEVKEWCK